VPSVDFSAGPGVSDILGSFFWGAQSRGSLDNSAGKSKSNFVDLARRFVGERGSVAFRGNCSVANGRRLPPKDWRTPPEVPAGRISDARKEFAPQLRVLQRVPNQLVVDQSPSHAA